MSSLFLELVWITKLFLLTCCVWRIMKPGSHACSLFTDLNGCWSNISCTRNHCWGSSWRQLHLSSRMKRGQLAKSRGWNVAAKKLRNWDVWVSPRKTWALPAEQQSSNTTSKLLILCLLLSGEWAFANCKPTQGRKDFALTVCVCRCSDYVVSIASREASRRTRSSSTGSGNISMHSYDFSYIAWF